MNKKTLEDRLKSIQEQFNAAQTQRDSYQVEMNRLEGEFRLTNREIEELSATEKPAEPANSNQRPGKQAL
jgi:peptidoglycan hydrolase CwlO-like protein